MCIIKYPYLNSLFMNQGSGSIRQTSILYTLHVDRHIIIFHYLNINIIIIIIMNIS